MQRDPGAEARQAIDLAQQRRDAVAGRVRAPVWYWTVCGAALLVAFLAPAVLSTTGSALVVVLAACITVLGLFDVVVTRASGLRVRLNDDRRHPSLRGPRRGLLAAIALGSAATWIALAISPAASAACGVLAALVILHLRARALAAVRHDVARGVPG